MISGSIILATLGCACVRVVVVTRVITSVVTRVVVVTRVEHVSVVFIHIRAVGIHMRSGG